MAPSWLSYAFSHDHHTTVNFHKLSTSIGLSRRNEPPSNLVRLHDTPKVYFMFALVVTTFHRSETAYMLYHDLNRVALIISRTMTVPQITT